MNEPTYGYADSDGIEIAYAAYGDGPVDVVGVTSLLGNLGMLSELPDLDPGIQFPTGIWIGRNAVHVTDASGAVVPMR